MSQKIGTLRLALTFAGCFLGAGYVSGQELWQYFGAFGARGLLGLVLAVALLGGTGVLLLRLSARTGIETMDALIVRADIPWLRTVVGVLTAALMFGVVCIMAAGMGSRFGGPKQTTPVDEYGHFLLHYSLFDAYRAGFRKVVFVVKEDTAEEFRESVGPAVAAAFDVRYAYQKLDTLPAGYAVPAGRTKPWGTAHAVLCAAPEIDGPFAVINSDDYYGIEAYRLLYDFLAVPRPERSYAMVSFRLCNTVTANGSVSRGVCTERGGMLESITERTHIEQRGADVAYTEDGEHFIDLPGDTTVSMNFWGFSPLYLRELAQRFPAFLDENLPRNPLKCEYFVPSIVDAQLHAGTADVTMLHTDDAWHGVTYHDDLPDVVAALRALRDAGKYPDNIW